MKKSDPLDEVVRIAASVGGPAVLLIVAPVTARKDDTSRLPFRLPEPMVHGDLMPDPLLVH